MHLLRPVCGVTCILYLLTAGCSDSSTQPAGKDGWLKGSVPDKLDTVAKHLRGMDMAMIEIGARYNELYWAGQDSNWEYAKYQLDKIRTALEIGLEQRPKRAKSAEMFLTDILPSVREAIQKQDGDLFQQRFNTLTANCNTCHTLEKMGFIPVSVPENR